MALIRIILTDYRGTRRSDQRDQNNDAITDPSRGERRERRVDLGGRTVGG